MDFWKTPLRSDKWNHLLRHIAHLKEPEYTTITTEGQIQLTLCSFTIAWLGAKGPKLQVPRHISWKQLIQLPRDAHVLQVELRQQDHLGARKALHQAACHYGLSWNGPLRSPASQGNDRRIRFQVYAPKASHSALGAHMLCAMLKKVEGLRRTNIATEDISNDQTAKVGEMHSIG